jgi:hypothetical protein
MARITIVNSKDIMPSANNPTGCMSPERFLRGCQNCRWFRKAMEGASVVAVKDVLSNLKCKPKLNNDQKSSIKEYLQSKQRFNKSQERLERSGQKLESAGWKRGE